MRDILSPLATPNQRTPMSTFSRLPPAGISPSTSHSYAGLKSPSSSTMLSGEHDEATEKRERRRSRVIQLQQIQSDSPISPAEKRKSFSLNGLSSIQIAEHYANCIKLSTENKITSKNAFGLHLIDYMSDQLKKRELENFQVASTTLDASAKIYAGRVDAIHTETYKVLSGLGRSSDKNKPDEEQDENDTNADPNEQGAEDENKKKKKKMRKKKTVEANIKNIDMKEKDFEAKADPLFQIMSATFDEGGISSLLLNSLRCFDDQQSLALDSGTLIGPCPNIDECSQRQANDLAEITTDMVKGPDLEPLVVCPSFSSFNWNDADETSILPSGPSSHAFDINAESEPIPDMDEDHNDDLPPDMGPLDMEDMDNADSDTSHNEGEEPTDTGISIGDSRPAQIMDTVMKDISNGSTGTLMQVLAAEPSEYSFFNKSLLRTWAGPEHWKKGPLSRDVTKAKDAADKSQKKKKPVFKMDFKEETECESLFQPSKSVTLTKVTLTKNSKTKKTVPKYLHYETETLFKMFVKRKLMVKRQNTSSDGNEDNVENIENYNYENVNDRENFCPRDLEGDNDDDSVEFDFTAGGCEFSQSPDSQDFGSQPDGTMLIGDKLVAQPHKVAKIDISYAKAAKKLDVKRLKTTMWNIMTHDITEAAVDPEAAGTSEVNQNQNASPEDPEMKGTCTFQDLLTVIPDKVSSQTAKNLSVPIAFACLLHLANEKCLKLVSLDEDLGNIKISQGI